eukprot:gene644-239_t
MAKITDLINVEDLTYYMIFVPGIIMLSSTQYVLYGFWSAARLVGLVDC